VVYLRFGAGADAASRRSAADWTRIANAGSAPDLAAADWMRAAASLDIGSDTWDHLQWIPRTLGYLIQTSPA
jgi:hypothetical protein